MQKNITLKSKDKKANIYGVLDQRTKTNKIIIFVHGLTGHKNEHQFYNATKFFNKKNFATFRFDLYSGEKGGRRLEDCSIETHSHDLEQVIKYFNKKFKKIFLVGHSLGGPTIFGANINNISKIVLWDPSVNLEAKDNQWYRFDKKINAYVVDWGVNYIIGKTLINDWKKLDYKKWTENLTIPLKVICAGQGILKKEWGKIIKKFKCEKEFIIIKKAGHCFDEDETENKLFKETLLWFK